VSLGKFLDEYNIALPLPRCSAMCPWCLIRQHNEAEELDSIEKGVLMFIHAYM